MLRCMDFQGASQPSDCLREEGIMDEFDEKVFYGAQWLDYVRPAWWVEFDLEIFELNDPLNCVIGQVFGSYSQVFTHLDGAHEFAVEMGFVANLNPGAAPAFRYTNRAGYDIPFHMSDLEYAFLENAWRDLIIERQDRAWMTCNDECCAPLGDAS